MNPDDRTAQMLLADYATELANMRPDPALHDCTPLPWDTTRFNDKAEL